MVIAVAAALQMFLGLASTVAGCLPYEYEDPEVRREAAARFGAQYTLHAEPPPRIAFDASAAFSSDGGPLLVPTLEFRASFLVNGCTESVVGESLFSLEHEQLDNGRPGHVLVAVRGVVVEPAPECGGKLNATLRRQVDVSLQLPAELVGSLQVRRAPCPILPPPSLPVPCLYVSPRVPAGSANPKGRAIRSGFGLAVGVPAWLSVRAVPPRGRAPAAHSCSESRRHQPR